MKIVGFPIDPSGLRDGRILRDLRTRRLLIQTTLDLVRAGDTKPNTIVIATMAGVTSRELLRHFPSLADLYGAAFDLAVLGAQGDGHLAVDAATPLSCRLDLLVSDRAQLFEEWLPVWQFAERVRQAAPAVDLGVDQLRRLLRERLARWFAAELDNLDPESRVAVLDSLDAAFGLDSWFNMRRGLRLSAHHASRTWRFSAEAVVLQALGALRQPPPDRPMAMA